MQLQDELSRKLQDPEFRRVYQREKLVIDVTEAICTAMEKVGMSRAELARLLAKSRSFVTQILSGSRNLTLSTAADALTAMGYELRVEVQAIGCPGSWDVEWYSSAVTPTVRKFDVLPGGRAGAGQLRPDEVAA